MYNELDFEKVTFTLRIWINFTSNDGEFLNARSKCIEKMSDLFKDNNLSLGAKEISLQNESK